MHSSATARPRRMLALPLPLLALVACDSSTGSSTGGRTTSTPLSKVARLVAGSDTALPVMGGSRDLRKSVRIGGVEDTIDETSVNFISYGTSGVKFNGSILVRDLAVGSYGVDTAYFSYRSATLSELSFFRYRPGVDTCYYSAMSGTLQVTALRDTTLSTGGGHLVSGIATARMGNPWAPRFESCKIPLDVELAFSDIVLRRYE